MSDYGFPQTTGTDVSYFHESLIPFSQNASRCMVSLEDFTTAALLQELGRRKVSVMLNMHITPDRAIPIHETCCISGNEVVGYTVTPLFQQDSIPDREEWDGS